VLLREFGNFISQRTRGQDVACRFGGEEFSIILAGASAEAACKRAELLREEVKQLSVQHAGQLLGSISISIGVAVFPTHATTVDMLLRASDQALYLAKNQGRDRVVLAPAP
jgi:diguanylate cyclase (GGDEF)-like protein